MLIPYNRNRQVGGLFLFGSLRGKYEPYIRSIGKQVIAAGTKIKKDIDDGKNVRDSLFEHVPDLIKKVPEMISTAEASKNSQSGSGIQRRRIIKRIRRRR
jgi:uncharacterized coiled-coil DUF342 family protein